MTHLQPQPGCGLECYGNHYATGCLDSYLVVSNNYWSNDPNALLHHGSWADMFIRYGDLEDSPQKISPKSQKTSGLFDQQYIPVSRPWDRANAAYRSQATFTTAHTWSAHPSQSDPHMAQTIGHMPTNKDCSFRSQESIRIHSARALRQHSAENSASSSAL